MSLNIRQIEATLKNLGFINLNIKSRNRISILTNDDRSSVLRQVALAFSKRGAVYYPFYTTSSGAAPSSVGVVLVDNKLITGPSFQLRVKKDDQLFARNNGNIDLAVEQGGNCPLSKLNKTVRFNGVSIIGMSNFPAMVASDASALYSRNLLNFIDVMIDSESGNFSLNKEDEIVAGTLVCFDGDLFV